MERKTTLCLAYLLQSCIDKRAHLAGKLLHAHTLRVGLFSDTFLSNRLIELYSKCNNTTYARNLFDHMPQKNIYSYNALLTEYCKMGNLENAYYLLAEMPERNVVSWNNLISALVRCRFEWKAVEVYDQMVCEGFVPTHFTLASVLSACGTLLDVGYGRRCHCLAIKIGLERNLYVGNALLCVYAKCGVVRDAVRFFEDMQEPNEVSFTVMMGGLGHTDRVVEALKMFRFMLRKGIHVDSVSLSSVLGVCARGACGEHRPYNEMDVFSCDMNGKQIHGIVIKLGFESEMHLSNTLLDMYAKNGDMDSAEKVFSNLPEFTAVSWNVMIAGYGQKYQSKKAIEYFQRMQSCGFEPDEVTYINILAACVKSGDIETARQMFDCMACPSVSSWNTILSGYVQMENHEEAIKLFREMQFRNVQPDRTTTAIILSLCATMEHLDAGKQVHAVSHKATFYDDIYVASGLISLYSKCGNLDKAERVLEKLPQFDIVCCNSMIAGFSINSQDKEAFAFYKQMQQNGISPTHFSYATILSCCAKLSSSFQGRQVHTQIKKEGLMNDIFVGSALIDMYCKCGHVDEARQFFEMMPCKNTVTWNEMIHGYAQNGCGDEAVHLYRDMIESGEKPDSITFVAVLTACSHSGLVDTGVEIFDSMQLDHGVEPGMDHYTCIIDALGRAGRFQEAEVVIEKMPSKDDPILWEVLLSSCRVYANVGLAKRAAEELFRLDPQNSAPYVLLANIFKSLGRWDDARAVRELMSDKQVIKAPGCSWIEHKREIESFSREDNMRTLNDDLHLQFGAQVKS